MQKEWTRESVLVAVKEFVMRCQMYPSKNIVRKYAKEAKLPSSVTICKFFKKHTLMIKALELPKWIKPCCRSYANDYYTRPQFIVAVYKRECPEYYEKFIKGH